MWILGPKGLTHTKNEKNIKQISSGSTENNNLLVVLAGTESKFENWPNSWVARDVTKNQTKKLSILLSFYFHEVLQYLNIFTYTNFWLERVLRFAREDA